MKTTTGLLLLIIFWLCAAVSTPAKGLDIGVGLGAVDFAGSDTFDGGWDMQVGYEFMTTEYFNFGARVHVIRGWTSKNSVDEEREYGVEDSTAMAFDSEALYLTVRPEHWWIQFRAGVVHAGYYTVDQDESRFGAAVGGGIVIVTENVRWHVFDYNRYQVGDDAFNVYSISLGVLFY